MTAKASFCSNKHDEIEFFEHVVILAKGVDKYCRKTLHEHLDLW